MVHINKLHIISILLSIFCALCCINTILISGKAFASANSPRGEIPSSSNFMAEDDKVPFTFWQKTVSVNGQPMDETYNYVFETLTPGAPMPEGSVGDKYYFSMTDDQVLTFYIEYTYTGTFKYKSSMILPEPNPYYTYDETYFDVRVEASYDPGSTEKIHVFCYNPIGEKVYDPGWTITLNQPTEPGPDPVNPLPQTFDANLIITVVAIGILLLCLLLVVIDKRKKNKYEEYTMQ